jgi:hypothetical protein
VSALSIDHAEAVATGARFKFISVALALVAASSAAKIVVLFIIYLSPFVPCWFGAAHFAQSRLYCISKEFVAFGLCHDSPLF